MPTFEWKGRRGDKTEGGVIVAENKEAVRAKLRRLAPGRARDSGAPRRPSQ